MDEFFPKQDDDNAFGDQPSVEISDDEFNSAASPPDVNGRINLRLEKALEQEIHHIAEDSRYPLKSVSQVVRFCCLTGIDRLRKWEPRPTLLGAIRAGSSLAARDKLQCDALDMLDRMDERIKWYVEHGAIDEAMAFAAEVESYFIDVQSTFWSRHIVAEIRKRFSVWYERFEDIQDGQQNLYNNDGDSGADGEDK